MRTKLYIHDQNCPLTPATRKFAAKEMIPLVSKDARITVIRLRFLKLSHTGTKEAYRVEMIAKGRGPTHRSHTHGTTTRAAIQSIRAKMNRRIVRQTKNHGRYAIHIARYDLSPT